MCALETLRDGVSDFGLGCMVAVNELLTATSFFAHRHQHFVYDIARTNRCTVAQYGTAAQQTTTTRRVDNENRKLGSSYVFGSLRGGDYLH